MDKKFYYSELEATIQTSPKIAYRESYPSESVSQRGLERDQDRDRDQYQQHYENQYQNTENNQEDDRVAHERVMGNLAKGYRKPAHQCPCPVHHQPQGDKRGKEISDSSDLESVQGTGFVDLFRRNNHYERVGPCPTALDLYSLNQVPMSKNSRIRTIREFRETQGPSEPKEEAINQEFDKSSGTGSLSPNEPSTPRAESPTSSKPSFRYRPQNSAKCEFHSRCCHGNHYNLENDPKVRQEDGRCMRKITPHKHFPTTERIPSESYTVKSSTTYTLHVNSDPGETPSESSDECSEQPPETETETETETDSELENQVGLETKSLGQAEGQASASYSFSHKPERFDPSPSLGEHIVFGSRASRKSKYEMDTRMRGGSVEPAYRQTSRTCHCMMHKAEEPRGSARPRSESSSPETRHSSVVTLLSPRVLEYSQSSLNELKQEHSHDCVGDCPNRPVSSTSKDTTPKRSCLKRTEDTSSVRRSSRTASECDSNSMRSVSEPDLVFRCSRGLRLPSLRTSDTFTEIWKKESPRGGYQSQSPSRFAGGLYSQVDKLKFKPIDRLDAGFSGSPIVEGAGMEEARERAHYFATQFDRLSESARRKDTELRIGQLRILQATSDKAFRRHYEEQRPSIRRVLTNGINFCCPLRHRQCPPVRNETLLSHTLRYHLNEHGLELREVFANDRLLLIFNPRSYDLGVNSCMSAMMYAGVRNDPSTLPGHRFLPIPNMNLPPAFARYSEHLPLFVMICRNRRSAIDGRRVRFDGNQSLEVDDNDNEDVLALWLVSVDLPMPVHVIMTVLNRRMDVTRSSVMQVRSLHQSQNCQKFMRTSRQYMRLSEQDLCVLTSDNTEPLYMEVSVKEYAGTLPLRHSR